jgi:cardiolipin synthase
MFTADFSETLDSLIQKAPASWLSVLCHELRNIPVTTPSTEAIKGLPTTVNPGLQYLAAGLLRQAEQKMSWEALSWVIASSASAYSRWNRDNQVELLWTIPSPSPNATARRIDQVLYDMINSAQREILLITFAAYYMKRFNDALSAALRRGVALRMILEFEEESNGALSYDAVNAFPWDIQRGAEIYYWPQENRERNKKNEPGKLHAKAAVIDDKAVISSANLTDDAFTRNLELGVIVTGHRIPHRLKQYCSDLVTGNTLSRWGPGS